jgi:CheY-like chemotaxis protein
MNSAKPRDPGLDEPSLVLCIEDQPVSMELVEAQLSYFPDVRLLKASTGREGVRLALEHRPLLILLDMRLPDIDGVEVVRSLNETITQKQMRVILLTADSFSIDVVKAMSLGAHAYWHKPLTLDRLKVELPRALQAARADRQRALARGTE